MVQKLTADVIEEVIKTHVHDISSLHTSNWGLETIFEIWNFFKKSDWSIYTSVSESTLHLENRKLISHFPCMKTF